MEELYDAAAALDAGERTRFLDQHCAGDENLRRELAAMFAGEGSGFTGVVEGAAAQALDAGERWTGRRMGPYRVLRPLGHGGMGAVYLATRDDDQYRKQVAVKTLKFDAGDPAMLSRFRHERQILAQLEHPNIAHLLDGGATSEGTPYIVLEYVDGVPITNYCDDRRLSLEERLRLFRQVCDAVQHAHRHLVVHRDIKPGNILVTPEGAPKLLDFGIAKILDPTATGSGTQTATAAGLHLMTPDYASPEQVRGEAISTATDVYSLGAVLYELLTGERPHALKTYAASEVARVICQTEIRPPSTLGHRRLRGDLDNIVLKALQKEPARRYSSVEQLSGDIRRYLEGLPISARPDTAGYRTLKFVRRHRIGVAAAAAVAIALTAGIALSMHEARIAQRRFAQVRELSNTFLFQFYDQVTPLPGSTAVRASIVETARKYLDGLSKDAGSDKDLILELAQAYERLGEIQGRPGVANLGQIEGARQSYQRAVTLYARLPVTPQSPPDLRWKAAWPVFLLSRLEFGQYHEEKAEAYDHRVMELLHGGAQNNSTRMLSAMADRCLGEIRLRQGRIAEALALTRSALQALRDLRASGFADKDLGNEIENTVERLGRTEASAGDLDGALGIFQELLQKGPACDTGGAGSGCRMRGYRMGWLADVYYNEDRPNLLQPAKAAPLQEQAISLGERIAAVDPNDREARFDLASHYGKLGDVVWQSDPPRALQLYDRALSTAKALVSKERFDTLQQSYLLAICRPLIQLGRYADARKALAELKQLEGPISPSAIFVDLMGDLQERSLWAQIAWGEGRHDEALRLWREVVSDAEKLRDRYPAEFSAVFYLSMFYRSFAARTTGDERRQVLLRSAAAWHSWPATDFTKRQEQQDLSAAAR